MAPSVQTLQKLAGETGLQAGTLEKVIRLLDLLAEIAADPVLKDRVALKGGTALNVFYLALDRLSVDIDLNYIGALDREAMQAERPEVEGALAQILEAQGYGLRRQAVAHGLPDLGHMNPCCSFVLDGTHMDCCPHQSPGKGMCLQGG